MPKLSKSKTPVIGFYSGAFSKKEMNQFRKEFNPKFPIYAISNSTIGNITFRYPMVIITQNGVVKKIGYDL
jgi:hypothetical protein